MIELLVVISIMGLIAGLAVPALKNLGKANVQASASRQLLDDIGRARQFAISQHTTVYMVFVPTNFFYLQDQSTKSAIFNGSTFPGIIGNGTMSTADQQQAVTTMSNLVNLQLTGYNFLSLGKVGDQPGQHSWHYLGDWQSLPDGTFIASAKFLRRPNADLPDQILPWQNDYAGTIDNWLYPSLQQAQIYGFDQVALPFPTEKCDSVPLPCLIFDSQGRLVSETLDNVSYHHAYIPLAQGAVSVGRDLNKAPALTAVLPSAITEIPPGNSSGISYNIIDVDGLSGRARLLTHQIP